jgi:hypothetical protein
MDLVDKIIELTDLFDDNVVTTADKIPQPEPKKEVVDREAINEFMKRNPMAGGGMLVQPGFGGVRQGYKGITEYNLEQRKAAFQELFDKHGENVVRKAFTDETGIKNLDKILKDTDYKNQKTKDILNNFKQKFKKNIKEAGKFLPGKESRIFSRGKRIPVEQGIQIKLLEATNSKDFFDPKAFAKANKISMATLKDQAERLQTNIYKKRIVDSKTALGIETRDKLEWIPKDSKFSDNALNKLWKSKLIKYERNKIDELFFDAFGRKTSDKYNPKKFLAIKKNLNEYRQLKKAINKRFPNIDFELDHPLSKSSLNKLFNATTDQLTRVNVLDADLNNGFKDTLSLQYEKAVQGNNLNKKKAVEKIARDLKLNIGKISDDATNFKYGVKEFQKLNIKDEIGKSLLNLSNLNKNFQTYAKNNPKLFEAAGVSPTQTFTRVTPSQIKKIQSMLKSEGPTLGMNLGFLKGFGEAIKSVPTPAGAVALNLGFGVDPTSAIDRASIAAETAFAPQLVKQAAKFGPVAQRFFNLGLSPAMAARAARIASPIGLASLGLEGLYQGGKFAKKRIEELKAMSPEERDELRRQGEAFAFDPFQAAGGGIAKLAGDPSGPPPEAGPNSQGLSSLMKRGTNI